MAAILSFCYPYNLMEPTRRIASNLMMIDVFRARGGRGSVNVFSESIDDRY